MKKPFIKFNKINRKTPNMETFLEKLLTFRL